MKGGGSNTSIIHRIKGLSPPVRKEKGESPETASSNSCWRLKQVKLGGQDNSKVWRCKMMGISFKQGVEVTWNLLLTSEKNLSGGVLDLSRLTVTLKMVSGVKWSMQGMDERIDQVKKPCPEG